MSYMLNYSWQSRTKNTACVRPLVTRRSYHLRAPQSALSKGDWGRTRTACLLNKEVKYAEIEVEGDGKEHQVEEKGGLEDRGKKVCFWRDSPRWDRASSFTRFLDHIRHTTIGRTPMDEWSARRTDFYPTTQNTHNRQASMPHGGIRTHNLSRRAAADPRLRPRGHWDRRKKVRNKNNPLKHSGKYMHHLLT